MKVSHIEHLGVAVKSLDEAIPYWENVLGLKCYAIEEVADQKVRTAFFMLGQTKIELLEPTSEESTIAKYIENRGVGIHHMALACENIEEQLADAEAKGIRLIDKTPRKGAEGMTIAFLHPKSTQGILTELCENKNKSCNKEYCGISEFRQRRNRSHSRGRDLGWGRPVNAAASCGRYLPGNSGVRKNYKPTYL